MANKDVRNGVFEMKKKEQDALTQIYIRNISISLYNE